MNRHLTEGEIHAWLDGELDVAAPRRAAALRAHLAACGACGARLDEEAELREGASAILAGAAPDAGLQPSLEELRARARATGFTGHAGSRLARHRRWAWAASVVLALGIGWAVRARVPVPAEEAMRAAGESAGAASGASAPAAGREEGLADAAPSPVPETGGARTGEAAVPIPAEALAPRVGDAVTSSDGDAGISRVADAAPGAGEAAASRAGDAAVPARGEPARAAFTGVTSDAADSIVTGARKTAVGPDPAKPEGDPEPFSSYAAGAVAQAEAEAERRLEPAAPETPPESPRRAQEALALDELVVTAAPLSDSASRLRVAPVAPMAPMAPSAAPGREPDPRFGPMEGRRTRERSRSADEAEAGGALVLTVESLEVLSVVWSEVAPGVRGVRVLQRLDPADTLELVVIPGSVDDEAAEAALAAVLEEPLRAGWSRLVRVREGAWIVARAPLSAAALSRLVEDVGRR